MRTQYDKLTRLMSCDDCHLVIDRDVLAAINIAKKGDDVFHRSKCLSGEAMVVESCLFPKVTTKSMEESAKRMSLNRTEPNCIKPFMAMKI